MMNSIRALIHQQLSQGAGKALRGRLVTVSLFSTCIILLFADQNLMAPNLTAIAHEFGFNDEERDRKLGGEIALAFFVLGAPASIIVGCLGDQYNRTALFAWTVGLGEGACLLTYFCSSFTQLYVCRAITGLSLGGAIPLIFSILGDLYAAEERHAVNAVVSIGASLGITVGQGIAGYLGPSFGWRLPFLVVSIPALICALAVLLFVNDPERGGMEPAVRGRKKSENDNRANQGIEDEHSFVKSTETTRKRASNTEAHNHIFDELHPTDESPRILAKRSTRGDDSQNQKAILGQDWAAHVRAFTALFSTPSVLLMMLQGGPGCVPWGIINTFLTDFLAKNRGMTIQAATTTVLFFGFGNFFGMAIGGVGGRFLYRLDHRYPSILAGTAAIVGCVPFWALLNLVDASSSRWYIFVVTILGGVGCGVTGPIVKATLQNVTMPKTRGQAFALFNLFDDFGKGLGPLLISFLITSFQSRATAFNVGTLGWVVCGVFNLAVFFTVVADEAKVQKELSNEMRRRERIGTAAL